MNIVCIEGALPGSDCVSESPADLSEEETSRLITAALDWHNNRDGIKHFSNV